MYFLKKKKTPKNPFYMQLKVKTFISCVEVEMYFCMNVTHLALTSTNMLCKYVLFIREYVRICIYVLILWIMSFEHDTIFTCKTKCHTSVILILSKFVSQATDSVMNLIMTCGL